MIDPLLYVVISLFVLLFLHHQPSLTLGQVRTIRLNTLSNELDQAITTILAPKMGMIACLSVDYDITSQDLLNDEMVRLDMITTFRTWKREPFCWLSKRRLNR